MNDEGMNEKWWCYVILQCWKVNMLGCVLKGMKNEQMVKIGIYIMKELMKGEWKD